MELIILGSSHGVPTPDRFCSCTLLKCGSSHYLIDAGAPIADLLIRYGIPYEAIRAVFLTHCHHDHTIGMLDFVNLASWYFTRTDFDAYYPEEDCITRLKQYLFPEPMGDALDRMRFHTYAPGVIYQDENITVTAIPTNHMEGRHPSYAFMVEGEGQRIIFTGDLHGSTPDDFPLPAISEPSDLVICELAHFHVCDVLPYLRKCQTRKLLFNHYNENWVNEIMQLRDEKTLPYPVDLLTDGDRILL